MHHVLTNTKSVDYSDMDMVREAELRTAHHHNVLNNNISNRRNKSKSTEDMNRDSGRYLKKERIQYVQDNDEQNGDLNNHKSYILSQIGN